MTIAFLNSIECETFGGMEHWLRSVAADLVRRGWKVVLMGRAGSEYLRRCAGPGVIIEPLDISGDFNPRTIVRIASLLCRHRVDLLSVNFNKDLRLGGISAQFARRIPVVWTLGMNLTNRRLHHRLLSPRLFDAVLVPSEALRHEVVSGGYIRADQVTVIPIGIEPDFPVKAREDVRTRIRAEIGFQDTDIVIVTVARLVYKKGHEFLIPALASLIGEFRNLKAVFLGDGPKRYEIETLIARHDLGGHVVLAGNVTAVDDYLAAADVMVHPAKEEPYGIALLEGMRAGLPIVATRVGGIAEVVEENVTATLVPPRDSAALADAIRTLLKDRSIRAQMGEAGRTRVERRFAIEPMFDKLAAYFARVARVADPTSSRNKFGEAAMSEGSR